jgi:hypothetical protein
LIAPIPRYVTSRCCDNNSHVENYESEDFEAEIIAGVENHKKLLEGWAMEHNLSFGIIDATELVDPVEPILRNRVTTGGIPLWTMWDPVHLVDEAYREMAEAILMPDSGNEFTDHGSTTSTESGMGGSKRKRPESVIVGQPDQPAKKGKSAHEKKPAGWLQGKAEWGRGRSHQGANKPYGVHHPDHTPKRGQWSWPRRGWPPRRPGVSRGRGWPCW